MAAVFLAPADDAGSGGLARAAIFNILPLTCNRKGWEDLCTVKGSVFRHRLIRHVEDRFRKRELQHDLALLIGHLDDRIDETGMRALNLEDFPDHGTRDFPSTIGVSQDFPVGI